MYFSIEEMSLEHFPEPKRRKFDSEHYYPPYVVFSQNLCLVPTSKFLENYPNQRPKENIHIDIGILLNQEFTDAVFDQEAWRAFFDDIDFSVIKEPAVIEFFLATTDLTGDDIDIPSFEIRGKLVRPLMDELRKIKDVNTRTDYVPFDAFDEDDDPDKLFYHAYKLIEAGFHPTFYDGHSILFEPLNAVISRLDQNHDAFLPRDGDGYGWDGYDY